MWSAGTNPLHECMMISEKTRKTLSKAVVPALGVAGFYYLFMCFVFDMSKGVTMSGIVSFGIAVFIGLSLAYRR